MTTQPSPQITRLLVANRGEIARRVFRTAHAMGIDTVAVFSDPDEDAPFVGEATYAVRLGGQTSAESYLDAGKILDAARRSGADAIHPGYGFLSENPDVAEAVTSAGLVWVGPTADQIRAMALKVEAKRLVAAAGVLTIVARQKAEGLGIPWDDEQFAPIRDAFESQVEEQSTALYATGRQWDDGIIDPRDTRTVLGIALSAIHSAPVQGTHSFGVFRL